MSQACWIIRLALSLGELLLGVRALRKQGRPEAFGGLKSEGVEPVEDSKFCWLLQSWSNGWCNSSKFLSDVDFWSIKPSPPVFVGLDCGLLVWMPKPFGLWAEFSLWVWMKSWLTHSQHIIYIYIYIYTYTHTHIYIYTWYSVGQPLALAAEAHSRTIGSLLCGLGHGRCRFWVTGPYTTSPVGVGVPIPFHPMYHHFPHCFMMNCALSPWIR